MSNHPLVFTADNLLRILQSLPCARTYVVGLSGGADSTALLHAISVIKDQLEVPVSAVHINHGLHHDADEWQSCCETLCQQLGIELVSLNVKLTHDTGKGLEAEARQLRYATISTLLTPGAALLTAHHADDQAETLLLNLMRGSGVDGLSAMPASRRLEKGLLQRPLLSFHAAALRDYLRENDINWCEDPSNQHLQHDRNFVRQQVIPLLEQRWPKVSKRLLLTSNAMNGARLLLEGLADRYLDKNLKHVLVLQIDSKAINDPDLLQLVIRRWLRKSGASSVPVYRLKTLCQQIQQVDTDQNVSISWDGWIIRMFRHQLWLSEDKVLPACPQLDWKAGKNRVYLGPELGTLAIDSKRNDNHTMPMAGKFSIGSRINMHTAAMQQGDHHKSLKNLFQEADVPPWLRNCIPLCCMENELVAIGDWRFSDTFDNWMKANKLSLNWQPEHPLLQFIAEQHQRDLA